MPKKPHPVFLRRHDVQRVTGLATSTLYGLMQRGEFPRPVRITSGRVGWIESEVRDWQQERIAKRDGGRKSGARAASGAAR
jgi:prophage regulatory protein